MKCWGGVMNITGGTGGYTPNPEAVPGVHGAKAVSAGFTACALIADGSVQCWDWFSIQKPVPVPNLTDAVALSIDGTGDDGHSCALRAGGKVACWGQNGAGELGTGKTGAPSDTPIDVSLPASAVDVTAGATYSCATLDDGTVACWGDYNNGPPLPDPQAQAPVKVFEFTGVKNIVSSGATACALRSVGDVRCWGDNTYGQLGTGTLGANRAAFPVPVHGLNDAIAISVGDHTCAIRLDHTLVCWGDNADGELGIVSSSTPAASPVAVPDVTDVDQVAVGAGFTCALKSSGAVVCWGKNTDGELGDGTTTDSAKPVQVRL